MYWIALKMLVGDKAKFLGIVMGLTFAAALITQQGSIFCGLMLRTCAQITDITGADLWVMDPSVRFVDDIKPMLESNLQRVRGVDGVKWAVPLYKGNGRAKLVFTPACHEGEDLSARSARAGSSGPFGAPSNPFTKVLDLLAPGIDAVDAAAGAVVRQRDRQRDRAGDPAGRRRHLDGGGAAERADDRAAPQRADAGRRTRGPAQARLDHRRPRWPEEALPGLPPRRAVREAQGNRRRPTSSGSASSSARPPRSR